VSFLRENISSLDNTQGSCNCSGRRIGSRKNVSGKPTVIEMTVIEMTVIEVTVIEVTVIEKI
jgi:hypothetical protein